jgi:hypothetical protein
MKPYSLGLREQVVSAVEKGDSSFDSKLVDTLIATGLDLMELQHLRN